MTKIPIRRLITTRKEPDFSELFSIRKLQDLLAGKDMVQELHRHDFFYILALETGEGKHDIDFMPYQVNDRSIFIMRPGQVHALTLTAESTGYLMGFKSDFYHPENRESRETFRKATNKKLCQLDVQEFTGILNLLTSIFQEYTVKREKYQEVIKANLSIFFIELVRHWQLHEGLSNDANAYLQERLDAFFELVETHFAVHKQVAQYAEMMNLSPYQLNAITKTTLGKTCSEIINEYIILESKRHLLATSNQVNQIAYLLGYEDASYFIRFFKKHTGYSPEAFRNNFR